MAHQAVDFVLVPALYPERVADVLIQALPGEKPEILEHHGHLGPRAVHRLALEGNLAPLAENESVHDAKKRRLPAPAGAEDGQNLLRLHVDVDVVEHVQGAEPFPDALEAQCRIRAVVG